MKRIIGMVLLAFTLLLSVASAMAYSPYGYNYIAGAGGYPPYNGHPYTYGPGGWGYYGPYTTGGFLYLLA